MKKLTFILILIFALLGAVQAIAVDSDDKLHGTWELIRVHMLEAQDQFFEHKTPYIKFEDGRISGVGGCNQFTGSYQRYKNELDISDNLAMTRMHCGGDGETKFMNALMGVDAFVLYDDILILIAGRLPVMTFHRQ